MTKAEIQAILFVAVSMLAGACVLLVKQYDSDFLPDLGPVPADTRLDAGGRTGSASTAGGRTGSESAAGIGMARTDGAGQAADAGGRTGPASTAGGRTGSESAAGIGMAQPDGTGPGHPSNSAEKPGQLLVPVNTAPASELQKLPGIGPKLAEAIMAYRKQSGHFASVEQLLEVKGIGPAKLRRLRPFVELK